MNDPAFAVGILAITLAITMGIPPSRTFIKYIIYYFLDIIFIIIQIYL